MRASVIIPSYNSRERLYYNLISLNNQDCGNDLFEVVVVDNGSTDNTIEMLKRFKADYKLKFVRIQKNQGIARGRNEGVKRAIGDILIFHDSDMIAPKDFISRHLEHHKEKNIVVCGNPWKRIFSFYYKELKNKEADYLGKTLPSGKNYPQRYPLISEKQIIDGSYMKEVCDLNTEFMIGIRQILDQYNWTLDDYVMPWRFFITNNASVERRRVIDVGMFDKDIVGYGFEDYDLGIRLYKSGSKFVFDKDILNVHQEHPTNINYIESLSNINYVCEKYNNIYFIDVILVCIYGPTSIDGVTLNDLVKDINKMLPLRCFTAYLEEFLELLQTFRKRFFSGQNNQGLMPQKEINVNKLIEEMKRMREEFNIKYFADAFLAIIKDIYNIDARV